MTRVEHYRTASQLLTAGLRASMSDSEKDRVVARAHVHALLAAAPAEVAAEAGDGHQDDAGTVTP